MARRTQEPDREFPRAILHVDGDAFFASAEVARRPELRGKPVVVGAERGIATALTYEAKALGIERGMPISRIRRKYKGVVILSGDYAWYAAMSRRMNEVIARYTPEVEHYSIDESFADLTGHHIPRKQSYEEMARAMKCELQANLNMTFSVGVAPSKALAKVASKNRKPDGFTMIPTSRIREFLAMVPVENIWGIGRRTAPKLRERGVATALQFIHISKSAVEDGYAKPYVELWRELSGESVWPVRSSGRGTQKSYAHTRTFTPATTDRAFLLRELSRHTESVCASAREDDQAARGVSFFLKSQSFKYTNVHIRLLAPSNIPSDIIPEFERRLDDLMREGVAYRASGVTLFDLVPTASVTEGLFDAGRTRKLEHVYKKVDAVNERFGKTVLRLAAGTKMTQRKRSLPLERAAAEETNAAKHHARGMPFSMMEE